MKISVKERAGYTLPHGLNISGYLFHPYLLKHKEAYASTFIRLRKATVL